MLVSLNRNSRKKSARLIRLAEEADADDIPDGMDIPEELNYREKTFDPVKIIS